MFGIKVNHISLLYKIRFSFDFNVGLMAVLAVFNILYKIRIVGGEVLAAENLWNPTWLLFGPAYYFAHRYLSEEREDQTDESEGGAEGMKGKRASSRAILVHYIPFLFFGLFYILAFITTRTQYVWDNPVFVWYQNSFFAIPFSLLAYAFYGFKKRHAINMEDARAELLTFLGGFLSLIAVLYILMYLCWGVFKIDMGIDYRIFTYILLFIAAVFVLRYRLSAGMGRSQREKVNGEEADNYSTSFLSPEMAANYISQIEQYFLDEQAFVNPELSLDVLSKALHIPRHYFSPLFNQYIGKSFYSYVAEQRIAYATRRLKEEHGRLKIESLAYESGFNSKTSFNRYFKQFTGITPLQFMQQQDDEQGDSLHEAIA